MPESKYGKEMMCIMEPLKGINTKREEKHFLMLSLSIITGNYTVCKMRALGNCY